MEAKMKMNKMIFVLGCTLPNFSWKRSLNTSKNTPKIAPKLGQAIALVFLPFLVFSLDSSWSSLIGGWICRALPPNSCKLQVFSTNWNLARVPRQQNAFSWHMVQDMVHWTLYEPPLTMSGPVGWLWCGSSLRAFVHLVRCLFMASTWLWWFFWLPL